MVWFSMLSRPATITPGMEAPQTLCSSVNDYDKRLKTEMLKMFYSYTNTMTWRKKFDPNQILGFGFTTLEHNPKG